LLTRARSKGFFGFSPHFQQASKLKEAIVFFLFEGVAGEAAFAHRKGRRGIRGPRPVIGEQRKSKEEEEKKEKEKRKEKIIIKKIKIKMM